MALAGMPAHPPDPGIWICRADKPRGPTEKIDLHTIPRIGDTVYRTNGELVVVMAVRHYECREITVLYVVGAEQTQNV
jgi:hypothetical protein